jgi:epoxide hydrolase-like predicted phosphatase
MGYLPRKDALSMKQANAIQAVIWDMGGVIVRTHDHGPRARWETRLGLNPGQLEEIVFRSDIAGQAYVGAAQVEDVWRTIGEQLGVSTNDLPTLEKDFWSGDRVDFELVDTIRSLRPERKTALLSNAWIDLRSYVTDVWKIADAFDHLTISAEVGAAKPDAIIYQLTLEALAVEPQQAVFIDDFKINLRAAREIGLLTIHFRDVTDTLAQLKDLLSETG